MHFFTFAEKDTTLYQDSGSLNAGLDEVLEIRKDVSEYWRICKCFSYSNTV